MRQKPIINPTVAIVPALSLLISCIAVRYETSGKLRTAPTTNVTRGSPLPSIRSGNDSVGLPASFLAFSLASFFSRRRA